MNTIQPISLHGGHSGQFCNHASDMLEDIVLRYIELGFKTVGITEHVPPVHDKFLYPEEIAAGLTALDLNRRFENYFTKLAALKTRYAGKIKLLAGMETETYTGYQDHIKALCTKFNPDYIVGSVHHINDISLDFSKATYGDIVASLGSHEAMYEAYFDQQYEMIKTLEPFVVGHFDLVIIHDPDYEKRLSFPGIKEKIMRNLSLIQSLGLVLDFNLRILARGKSKPHFIPWILTAAKEMGICVIPGDDSHGVADVGCRVEAAIDILKAYGCKTDWPDPVRDAGCGLLNNKEITG